MELNRENIIWAAGLFEGEGCIYLAKRSYGVYPKLKLKMTDKDTVEKFANIFGLETKADQKYDGWKSHWKDPWYTETTGKKAYAILAMLFPWLGKRRQEKAVDVINQWRLCNGS